MPRKVDHGERRREIVDAVVRITVKGGLSAATFREVAAEAGVSVRLVQYYFGGKDELLLATQRHVAARSVERMRAAVQASDGSPKAWLRAVLGSFIPVDDDSRVAILMYVALHTESLIDPTVARPEAFEIVHSLQRVVADQLRRGKLARGVDPELEAAVLTATVPSLAQSVLDGSSSSEQAFAVLEYALDRVLR